MDDEGISWYNMMQKCISMEAELVSASDASEEVI